MERVTLTEAARRLGLTAIAVRKRAQRGTLAAEKVDGAWTILLPARAISGQADGPASTDGPSGHPSPEVGAPPVDSTVAAELRGRVAALERETAGLWEQLAVKDRQIGELHVLLQQSQRVLTTHIPASTVERSTVETPDRPESSRASWWRRLWRATSPS